LLVRRPQVSSICVSFRRPTQTAPRRSPWSGVPGQARYSPGSFSESSWPCGVCAARFLGRASGRSASASRSTSNRCAYVVKLNAALLWPRTVCSVFAEPPSATIRPAQSAESRGLPSSVVPVATPLLCRTGSSAPDSLSAYSSKVTGLNRPRLSQVRPVFVPSHEVTVRAVLSSGFFVNSRRISGSSRRKSER
jgi:hypothetical protein